MQYVYVRPNELTSPKFCKAFAVGCHGEVLEQYKGGDWAGFGSPDNWFDVQYAKRNGYNWYYGDHAYFGRHKYYRITKNNYQLMQDTKSDCKRFLSFNIPIKPWNCGKYIVICLQSYCFMQLNDIDRDVWLENIKNELKKYTDRPIKIREKRDKKPLEKDLLDAYCVITYTSNAAMEAILSGVPAICLGDCVSSRMSVNKISDINNLKYPENRLEWAGSLADNQWTLKEIKSGMAWEALNEKI